MLHLPASSISEHQSLWGRLHLLAFSMSGVPNVSTADCTAESLSMA